MCEDYEEKLKERNSVACSDHKLDLSIKTKVLPYPQDYEVASIYLPNSQSPHKIMVTIKIDYATSSQIVVEKREQKLV